MKLKLSQDEETLLIQKVRENPELARRLLEMTDIVGDDLGDQNARKKSSISM